MKTCLRSVAPDDIRSGGHPVEARSEFHGRFGIPERRPPRFRVFVGLLAVLGVLSGMYALAASAETVEDLRGDIATGDALRAELSGIAAERAAQLVALTSAETRLAELLADRDALGEDQRRLAAEIEAATVNLERLAVETFITGGDTGSLEHLAAVSDANDVAWRRTLIRSHTGSSKTAIDRLRALRGLADSSVVETIEVATSLRSEIGVHERVIEGLADREAEILAVLPLAEAWDRAAIAIASGQYGIAPAEKWEKLRHCESTHDYQAISPSGLYRGAYQFDLPTWRTVGGTGDPALASPEEQDARARELYARRGSQPWPICGRFLE